MRNFKILTWLLYLSVLVFCIWAGLSWWRVSVVECWFDGVVVESTQCGVAAPLHGQRMLVLDLASDRWQVLRSFTGADQQTWQLTQWHKRLPQTVVLRFESSPATYVVMLPDNSWWLVNQLGFLQSLTPEQAVQSGLPKVIFGAKWPAASYAHYRLQQNLHGWLQQLTTEITTTVSVPLQFTIVDDFTVTVSWPDWQLIISPFMDLQQLTTQLSQIKLLLSEKNQTLGADYKKLDLRFKLPVLEPKNPQSQTLFPSLAPKPTATASTAVVSQTQKLSPQPTAKTTTTPLPTPTQTQVNQ